MKRNKIRYDRWLRTLFLSFALLTGGGGWMVWGQTRPTGPVTSEENRPEITLKDHIVNGINWHDSVFYETKKIYAWPGKERELFIPELRINLRGGNDERFNWFVHWYVIKGENVQFQFPESLTVSESISRLQGGYWTWTIDNVGGQNKTHKLQDYFVKAKSEDGQDYGWVWSKRIRKNIWSKDNGQGGGYGMDASTIRFSGSEYQLNNGIEIWCDVSIYQDGSWKTVNSTHEYTEPTLLKRYKFQILNAKTENSILTECETIEYDYPYSENNKTINFSMPYAPDNYFDTSGNPGEHFEYKTWLDGDNEPTEYKKFNLVTRNGKSLPLQQAQRISDSNHYNSTKATNVKVRVSFGDGQTPSMDVAHFIFKPKLNSNFELESKIKDNNDRWPRNDSRYKLINNVDFDNKEYESDENGNIKHVKKTDLRGSNASIAEERNNMSGNPFGYFSQNSTTYGFLIKGAYTLLNDKTCSTSNQNIYGLFRSANLSTVSANGTKCGNGNSSEDNIDWIRNYLWIPAVGDDSEYKNKFLLDRTYEITKNTPDEHCGYFYYIDASNDAGTLVNVAVNDVCANTELIVTAWVADMTRQNAAEADDKKSYNPLAPNINLIFKAIDPAQNNKEVVLHRFTSCDALVDYGSTTVGDNGVSNSNPNKNLMQWQQLCYKFVVDKPVDGLTNFHLEIQNNEPHTDGADYAIDDIRIFRRKPEVSIIQAGYLCDTEVKTVKYVSSYSNIMTVMGLKENEMIPEGNINRDVTWEETPQELKDYFLNTKKLTEHKAKEYVESHFTKVYYSVYECDEKEEPKDAPLSIDYDGDGNQEYCRMSFLSTVKEDMKWVDPSFNSDGKDAGDKIYSLSLEIGKYFNLKKKYIARISSQPLQDGDLKCGNCALTGDPFQLSVAGDRFTIYESNDLQTEIESPENVEQGVTYKIAGCFSYLDNGTWKELEDAQFDWFIGTLEEFNTLKVTLNGNEYTIAQLLPTISTSTEVESKKIIEELTKQYGEYGTDKTSGKFVFGKHDFDYTMANKYQTIIGLPHALQDDGKTVIGENLYCTDPVVIQLGPTPPTIDPGDPDTPDPKDPEDPKDPKDPDPKDPDKPQPDEWGGKHVRSVRVMLTQIQDMQANRGTLRIPIHFRKSAEGEKFVGDENNTNIKVWKTSDTKWDKSKTVATLEDLVDKATTAAWGTNYFTIKFTEDAAKNFKEGFWYMVDIPYAVKDNNGNGTVVYTSSMKLTLKIVPEYVTWVGSAENMHNWNNDGPSHWRRSNNTELYITDNKYAEANGNHTEAYTPMRFTKVTVAGNKDGKAYSAYPYLYELKKNTGSQKKDPKNVLLNMDVPTNLTTENIGAATKNIEYDLLADPDYEQELFGSINNPDKLQDHSYSCVRFYGNTCDEIYIKPESEILHTEFLTYNKARVDYEMAPNRWYMLASPLKGVVSGDMYLPTGTGNVGKYARQETPAFGEINYDNTNYTRWQPAVYMRGWNKASAIVVRPGTGSNNQVDYGIQGSWSNLYNDVDVPFTPGTGFSIGTKANETTLDNGNKVLFRLPKADTEYTYYGSSNGTKGDNTTLKNREGNGRFHISPNKEGKTPVTEVQATGEMFGNPFMSHLDMSKFFNNSTGTYYILSEGGTTTNILGEGYSISTKDNTDPKFVAPLQSFIVKDQRTVTFTTDMIAKAPTTGKPGLRSATVAPAEEPLPQLRITATRDGVRNTAVVAGLATASDSYVEGEDAALLINEEVAAPQVYTLAGNQMVAINVTPDLAEIPVGIHGKDATPVELSFKLSGAMKNVKLVDKQTGKRYDVTDGLTLTVPGNTYGRYFLNGSIATSNEIIARNHIIFYNSAPGRIDVSSVDALSEVTVYDIAGRALRTLRNLNTPTASVDHLAPGIYVIRAESGSQTISEKVEVK